MFRFLPLLVVMSLIALVLSGCGSGSDEGPNVPKEPTEPTGFRGVIQKKLPSGEIVPLADTTVVAMKWEVAGERTGFGGNYGTTKTDAQGNFFLPFPPGEYVIGSDVPGKDDGYACEGANPVSGGVVKEGVTALPAITHSGCE